jgi:hypothetical protein
MSGITPLNNVEINEALKSICPSFRGVFSADNIPNQIDSGSIICNLSRADEVGSHFVTIIIKPKYVRYIDTFGIPCQIDGINRFLYQLNRLVLYNSTQIQSLKSSFCGYFTMLFCLQNDHNCGNGITFSDNLTDNDQICIQYLSDCLQHR